MSGSFGPPFLRMTSISISQCPTSVYETSGCLGTTTISLPFNTQRITAMNVVFGNAGCWLLAVLLVHSPNSVASRLLPHLPLFVAPWISLKHFFKTISTHCQWIHSVLSKFSTSTQFYNVWEQSATAVSQCRGASGTCLKWFCTLLMDQCFFSRYPATHTIFHLLNGV